MIMSALMSNIFIIYSIAYIRTDQRYCFYQQMWILFIKPEKVTTIFV